MRGSAAAASKANAIAILLRTAYGYALWELRGGIKVEKGMNFRVNL